MTSEAHDSALPSVDLALLGRRLRTYRESLGLTQDELAARSGLSVSFTSLLERGARSPSYETLFALSRALGISVVDLLRERSGPELQDPVLARLVSFARQAQLTSSQVERWIAVGRAMFGPFAGATPQDDVERCTEAGCDRPVLARRLCAPHYHQQRRRRLRQEETELLDGRAAPEGGDGEEPLDRGALSGEGTGEPSAAPLEDDESGVEARDGDRLSSGGE